MLERVRQIKVRKGMIELLDEEEILIEFFDRPDHFYSTNKNHIGIVYNIKTMSEYLVFNDWFENLPTIPSKETDYFKSKSN
jgi:hypothetical protein